MSDNVPKVIKCSDHQYAPYSIVCIHLLNGTSTVWEPISIDDYREVDFDWVCPECLEDHLNGRYQIKNLVPCCINCLRKIKQRPGLVFKTLDDE